MSFIALELSPTQRQLIRHWHQTTLDKAGHYGDGVATFPDEAAIMAKLNSGDTGALSFTDAQVRQILDWGRSATRGMVSPDEDRVLRMLEDALGEDA